MSWPTPSDYSEVIQNPKHCFNDAELREGTPTLSPIGLPKPISGAFASVYQLNCRSGRFAVRCFLREFADQQRRYDAISNHLQRACLPYTVRFEFQRQGIRIRGAWYPILKMEWIDGEALNDYVGRHLNQPQVLNQIAKQWIELMKELKAAQIAHGDLQHGNVIVSQSRLRLIDYDGMYVPALQGLSSHEEGHRNYQHPGRTSKHFDSNLDNFSAWVIFLSIAALAVEPRLWHVLNGGDENLLFRREDFQRPHHSKALQALERSGKPELQALASQLRSILQLPLGQVPSLDNAPVHVATPQRSIGPDKALPNWLETHVQCQDAVVAAQITNERGSSQQQSADASWLIENIVEQIPPKAFFSGKAFILERVVALLFAASTIAGSFFAAFGAFPLAGSGVSVAVNAYLMLMLFIRYRSFDIVTDKAVAADRVKACRKAIKQFDTVIASLDSERERVREPLVRMQEQYRVAPAKQTAAMECLRKHLDQELAKSDNVRSSLALDERDAIREIEANTSKESSRLINERTAIERKEREELHQMQESLRSSYVQAYLRGSKVMYAEIPGIGAKLKAVLYSHGICSAADVDHSVRQISGIGPSKAASLLSWRHSEEQRARATAPSLSRADALSITDKYENHLRLLDSEIDAANARESSARQSVMDSFRHRRAALDQVDDHSKSQYQHSVELTKHNHEAYRAELIDKIRRLEGKTNAAVKPLDRQIAETKQSHFGLQIELCRAQRELTAFANVSFWAYLLHIVGLRRS